MLVLLEPSLVARLAAVSDTDIDIIVGGTAVDAVLPPSAPEAPAGTERERSARPPGASRPIGCRCMGRGRGSGSPEPEPANDFIMAIWEDISSRSSSVASSALWAGLQGRRKARERRKQQQG